MDNLKFEKEKEERKREALKRHERLHKLFTQDRLAFERERKMIIDESINSVKDEKLRGRLRVLQESWDRKMRNAGSENNRFVLAQTFLWSHIFEVFMPEINRLNKLLN
ncbi:MAG: DUF3135 domain-containing protein, partial [Thermodesulfobacteriota bacterium]|nr:DUF3135 domain-containing protein [Thermodesulfobacteriota bacterium]